MRNLCGSRMLFGGEFEAKNVRAGKRIPSPSCLLQCTHQAGKSTLKRKFPASMSVPRTAIGLIAIKTPPEVSFLL